MSRAFDLGQSIRKARNGNATPPNGQVRISPPEWKSYKLITATTSSEVVPQNVYQMFVHVFGGGGNSGASGGGGGGGFACGIIDVVPGQLLPTITVGAAGGTSSFGTLLSATGGASNALSAAGGTGT